MRTPEPHKRVQAIHARATFTIALKSAEELNGRRGAVIAGIVATVIILGMCGMRVQFV
jgi:hypothetical protein